MLLTLSSVLLTFSPRSVTRREISMLPNLRETSIASNPCNCACWGCCDCGIDNAGVAITAAALLPLYASLNVAPVATVVVVSLSSPCSSSSSPPSSVESLRLAAVVQSPLIVAVTKCTHHMLIIAFVIFVIIARRGQIDLAWIVDTICFTIVDVDGS